MNPTISPINPQDIEPLADVFGALANPTRLRLLSFLATKPRTLDDIAAFTDLHPQAARAILRPLREIGLVNLVKVDDQRCFRLHQPMLRRYRQWFAGVEHLRDAEPLPATTWIDALPIDDYARQTMKGCFSGQRLKHIPDKLKKLSVIIGFLATMFATDTTYTEPDVNAILSAYHADVATLRRELIQFGYLDRTRDGTQYWRTDKPAAWFE